MLDAYPLEYFLELKNTAMLMVDIFSFYFYMIYSKNQVIVEQKL